MDNAAKDVSVWIVVLLAIIVVVGLFHYSDKVIEYKEHKIINTTNTKNISDYYFSEYYNITTLSISRDDITDWKYVNDNPNETKLEIMSLNDTLDFPLEVFFTVNGTTKIDMVLYENGTVEDYYYSKR